MLIFLRETVMYKNNSEIATDTSKLINLYQRFIYLLHYDPFLSDSRV